MRKLVVIFVLILCVCFSNYGSELEELSNTASHISFKTIDLNSYNKIFDTTSPMSRRSEALFKKAVYAFMYVAIGFSALTFISLFASIIITVIYGMNFSEITGYDKSTRAYNEKLKFLNGLLAGVITSWLLFGVSAVCMLVFWALHIRAKKIGGKFYSEIKNNQFAICFKF